MAGVEDTNAESDRELGLASMILQARQLAVAWTDSKAQNIIVACSILMAIIAIPLFSNRPSALSAYVQVVMFLSAIATLTSLMLSLSVCRFRMPFPSQPPNTENQISLVTFAGTASFFRQAQNPTKLSPLVATYTRELKVSAKDACVECYVEAIALNTVILASKSRLANFAVLALQAAIVTLGFALILHIVGI